jgi:tRNA(fMet)-specific endonuclease VapC
MNEVLVDTDILSYYFKGDINVIEHFNIYLQEYETINISIITYYEILSGLKFKKAKKQIMEFEEFVGSNSVIHITENSSKISSDIYTDLRNKGLTIGSSDILIAGIAIENDLTLVTNNEKHFSSIINLKIENWKN